MLLTAAAAHLLLSFPQPETAEAPEEQVSHHVSESRRLPSASYSSLCPAPPQPQQNRTSAENRCQSTPLQLSSSPESMSLPSTAGSLAPAPLHAFLLSYFYYDLIVSCWAPPTRAHAPAGFFSDPA
uniref:Uncharacterized protein n=1 Tax=Knipowitschia caucasica TaxID=637954 RepID=A0AAV2IYS2_KNICA